MAKFRRIIVIGIALVFFLFPMIWMYLNAFKQTVDIIKMPPDIIFIPTLKNFFRAIFEFKIHLPLINSIIISVASTVITIILASLASYGFTKIKSSLSNYAMIFCVVLRMIPVIIFLIPIYLMFVRAHFLNTYIGIIIVYVAFLLPFATWFLKGFFQKIPVELEEAAKIDGCSLGGILLRIIFPLAAPGIAVTSLFCFIGAWNEFLFALILTGRETRTLPVALSTFVGAFTVDLGIIFAGGIIATLPPILLTFLMSEKIIKGLTAGAIKG